MRFVSIAVSIGVAIAAATVFHGAAVPAKSKAPKLKRLELRVPKQVLVGQPFRATVRNLRPGSLAAFDTQDVTLGWVKADPDGNATVTSSLWREQQTPVTVTEIVNGKRTRKITTTLKVLPATFASPQATPTAPVPDPSYATAVPNTPGVTVVASNPCRPQSAPIRLWPLGDSLTVGGYGDPTGFTDSYRYALFSALRAEGITDVDFRGHIGAPGSPLQWGAVAPAGVPGEFSHSGLGGFTVQMINNDLDAMAAVALPDVVVVNLGTNGGTPAEYRELIAHLQRIAPKAVIVMGTLTPRVPELKSRKPVGFRAELNTVILALGNASDTDRLYTADVFNRMLGDPAANPLSSNDFADETHLSISGGTRFGQALLPEVKAAIAAFRTSPCG
jgi:lysophospholipase L1-like esterase